ncbi:MAG: rhodanese-like domain-containing protein [Pleomorphochaeta sp.]
MDNFDELISSFDLNFFGTGSHKISFEKMVELINEDKAYILDVRSKEECSILNFSFANNIPVEQVPLHINELPKDKTIIIFCSGATRATIIYTYLQAKGFKNSRILLENIGDISNHFKPGFVLKNYKSFEN